MGFTDNRLRMLLGGLTAENTPRDELNYRLNQAIRVLDLCTDYK